MVSHQEGVGSGNAASITFTVATSDKARGHVHFDFTILCEAESEVLFYEDVVRTPETGQAHTPVCINRALNRVSAWGSNSVYSDATLDTSGALLLYKEVIGNAKQVGGRVDKIYNWILQRGKTYSIIVNNQSGSPNETTIHITWARHVEVN